MYFYPHPIIDAIIAEPTSGRADLYRASGMDARTFLQELKMLLDERHIQRGDRDWYFLRKHSLAVYPKDGSTQIDEIDLNYISGKDLHHAFHPDEDWDDEDVAEGFEVSLFIEHIKIDGYQAMILQSLTDKLLDTSKYDYYLAAEFIDLFEEQRARERTYEDITIIHVDWYSLFSDGLKKHVQALLPGVNWLYFQHVEDAIQCIQQRMERGEPINLVITELHHITLDCYDFAKVVRRLDEEIRPFDEWIPILVYTITGGEHERIQKGLEEGVFKKYLPKSVDGNELKNVMLDLVTSDYEQGDRLSMIWN